MRFWGDRYGQLMDPFGHSWSIATHKQDLTPDQIEKAEVALREMMTSKNKRRLIEGISFIKKMRIKQKQNHEMEEVTILPLMS